MDFACGRGRSGPPDYVAAPLLATASALIGQRAGRKPRPAGPNRLICGSVPSAIAARVKSGRLLLGEVLPEIERRMLADFPDKLREWNSTTEIGKAATQRWRRELREAERHGGPLPSPPVFAVAEPQAPRLRQNDVTIEKVAELLGAAAPKGLLIVRDELAGWIAGNECLSLRRA